MRSQVLIDAIVHQTTVLIARLSTAEGARSPLGHIANEVFTGLVTELESQGVSKKVIADMFGLALRSYRQKVHRLGESATSRGVTLWSAVQTYLAERESTTRAEVVERFEHDEEASVRGILNDLTESGFVLRSGRGEDTRYRVATEEELLDVGAALAGQPAESLAALVWLQIYRDGPVARERLAQLIPQPRDDIDAALEKLTEDGRVRLEAQGAHSVYVAQQVLIPIGETAGWEAAVVDHHGTVLNAIAAKIGAGARVSAAKDEVGGTTLTFDLWPGHPNEKEVRKLLASTRARVLPLWKKVAEHNEDEAAKPAGAADYQLHYYCGQYVVTESPLS